MSTFSDYGDEDGIISSDHELETSLVNGEFAGKTVGELNTSAESCISQFSGFNASDGFNASELDKNSEVCEAKESGKEFSTDSNASATSRLTNNFGSDRNDAEQSPEFFSQTKISTIASDSATGNADEEFRSESIDGTDEEFRSLNESIRSRRASTPLNWSGETSQSALDNCDIDSNLDCDNEDSSIILSNHESIRSRRASAPINWSSETSQNAFSNCDINSTLDDVFRSDAESHVEFGVLEANETKTGDGWLSSNALSDDFSSLADEFASLSASLADDADGDGNGDQAARKMESGDHARSSSDRIHQLAMGMADSVSRILLNSPRDEVRRRALRITGQGTLEKLNVQLGNCLHKLLKTNMDSGFYRGTNSEQDGRFSDKEKKLLKTMKFESVLDTKVNLSKVNMEVIKPWITDKINELMGAEDDVLVEYCFTQLEEANVNPKIMQINLTGFLNARMAREFMAELWQLFIDAQASPDGIPSAIVGKKMEEMKMWSNNGKQRDSTSLSAARPAASELSKSTESDWNNRYQSLTGGRYGGRDRGTSAATPASETTPQRRARSPSPPSHRRGRSPSPPSHRRGSSRRRDRDVERRSERGRGDRERSHERSRDRSRERDRHFERDRDRSRDRERERERNRERDHSRERGAGVRDREREREERFRDYLNSNRTSDRGKERHRDETKEAQIEAARDKQQPDSEDEFGPSEGVLRKRTSSHSSASNHSKSSSPQRANVAATATHGDYEEDDSADEAHRRKLVSSKVVIRQYSENEKDAKKLDFESDDEKHKKKRKRKKEHRNEEDSDAERKSKKHKKEKRKKRDKDDD